MMLNHLRLLSLNDTTEAPSYKIDPSSAFPECAARYWIEPVHGKAKIIIIHANESKCLWGSFIIASNSSYTVTAAIPTKGENGTYSFTYEDPIENALAVLAKYNDDGEIDAQPVAKIECKNTDENCFVQVLAVPPSFNRTKNFTSNGVDYNIKITQTSVISTLTNGSQKLNFYQKVNKTSNTTYDIEISTTVGVFGGIDIRKFKYVCDFGCGFYSSLSDNIFTHGKLNGTIGNGRSAFFYPVPSSEELNNNEIASTKKIHEDFTKQKETEQKRKEDNEKEKEEFNVKEYKEKIRNYHSKEDFLNMKSNTDIDVNVEIIYELSTRKSFSTTDNTTWFFPEINATLTANGGIYTASNIDASQTTTTTTSSNKHTTAIIVSVCCVVALAVIIVAAVFVIKFKKNKTTTISSSPLEE